MSTFKQCTYNTIKNRGDAINGRLKYYQLSGGNDSRPVYFGLKDDTTWVGKLSTKGSSSFYLATDTTGCSAEVKDSTYTPTTADANTAREIWLSIPKATATRTIIFSYKGTNVLTVIQQCKTTYNLYIVEPYRTSITSDDISAPVYYLTMDNTYNEEYIVRSEENNVNIQTSNFTNYLILILDVDMSTFNPGFNLLDGTFTLEYLINNYNLTHVMGDTYNDSDMRYDNFICSFARGMYDSEQDTYINNLYQTTEYNASTIYVWNPANLSIHSDTFILAGEFSLTGSSSNFRIGQYTIEF